LRNIYYLRLGSKIRQGFVVTTPSLTPPLSLPLSGCRGKQMRGVGEENLLYSMGEPAAPLPGGRPPAAQWRGGRGAAGSRQGLPHK